MKLIYSSIYGQLFGLPTKVSIRPNGVLLVVKNKATEIKWKNLTCPPRFSSTWLGKTIIFSTAGDNFILTNLAYSSEKKYKTYCEQLWIAENSNHLSTLLDKIDTVVTSRYLRQSQIKNIHLAIKKEYSKWFPWAKTSEALGDT
ncbi:MAG: AAA family ATPase, partial [Psychromonas sp.]